ncbi:MAG: hypothetical protein IPL53_11345 [Ignavibacteria bacterium]|nr:hypothetical protein [Ignavibacteria bacterium]
MKNITLFLILFALSINLSAKENNPKLAEVKNLAVLTGSIMIHRSA